MSIQRYRGQLLDGATLPDDVGTVASITRVGPELDVDINLSDDAFKADLDEAMAASGFTFVATSPTTPAIQIARQWPRGVIDKDLTDPPGGPSNGDRYIVAAPGGGAWVGQDNNIAQWDAANTMWLFDAPLDGTVAWVDDEAVHYLFTTADGWKRLSSGAQINESITTENISVDQALTDTLDFEPVVSSVILVLNGLVQHPGAGEDYTLGGAQNRTITWLAGTGTAVDMATTDRLIAYYTRL